MPYEQKDSTYEALIDKAKMVEAERSDIKATVASATTVQGAQGKGEKGNDLGGPGAKSIQCGGVSPKEVRRDVGPDAELAKGFHGAAGKG